MIESFEVNTKLCYLPLDLILKPYIIHAISLKFDMNEHYGLSNFYSKEFRHQARTRGTPL